MEGSLTALSKYRFECAEEALEDAENQLVNAEEFLTLIKDYLKNKGIME